MKKEFKAIIMQHQSKNASYIEPPFDVNEVFGSKRVKVKALFDDVEYRGSVVFMDGHYMLGITKDIRDKLGKSFGDEINVVIEKDEEERTVEIPSDLFEALAGNDTAISFFKSLSYTSQKEYITWITSAKREETRQERVKKAAELLSENRKLR